MARAIKINTDRTYEVFDLEPYPHLHDVIGSYFDIEFLNGPLGDPRRTYAAIAADDEGYRKRLPKNHLATSLRGIFLTHEVPSLVGVVVVVGSDWEGEQVDVPTWAIALVEAIQKGISEAFEHAQDPSWN